MLRVVDGDIESPQKIVPDIYFCYKVVSFFVLITVLRPHRGCHGACSVTSYRLHLSVTPLLRANVGLHIYNIRQGLRNLRTG